MANRRPRQFGADKHRICIVCEGFEEEQYFNRLKELRVWNDQYDFKVVNAKTCSQVPFTYEYEYKSDRSELVLALCDTDRAPYEGYNTLKNRISRVLRRSADTAGSVIMYANPCTMQIILRHFDQNVKLSTQSKKKNAPIVAQLTGVEHYDAHKDQIAQMCKLITRGNYDLMRSTLQTLAGADTVAPSTNFGTFLDYFHDDSPEWIKRINERIRTENK